MTGLARFRDWWVGQYRGQGRLGKLIWLSAPLVFSCCFCWSALLIVVPTPDVEPTAEVVERAAATVDVAGVESGAATAAPTEELATAAPTSTRTTVPSRSPLPTATTAVTATEELVSPTARPSATPRPATIAPSATSEPSATPRPPTSTPVPPTVTRPPATATRPTATLAPLPTVTIVPPTVAPPTALPLPTATLPPPSTSGDVVISSVRYDGDVPQVESDEYAVILNRGATVVNLAGWRLNAGEPDQNFVFPSFDLQPGQSCRVYTNEVHPETCGFSFGRGDAIWRNSGDCGYLYNAEGVEVSRFCWS